MKDMPRNTRVEGPSQADGGFEQISSGLVATLWLCMLTALDKEQMDQLGETKAEVAFDLGIAVQVAEEQGIPLPEMMAEVFDYYNEQLALRLPSLALANQVADSYAKANLAQRKLH